MKHRVVAPAVGLRGQSTPITPNGSQVLPPTSLQLRTVHN